MNEDMKKSELTEEQDEQVSGGDGIPHEDLPCGIPYPKPQFCITCKFTDCKYNFY